jgi:hypothetical protein
MIKPWQQQKKWDVEGEGAVNERTAQRWFKRSASDNLSLEDEQRPGRPQIWDSWATKEAAEQLPSTSSRRLSDTLGPSKSTTHHHLTALGKIYKSCTIVLHELTAEQAQRGVEFCRKLLQLQKDHRFIKRIVTCDEKWIYLNNPDLQKQCLDKGQLPVPVTKRKRFEKRYSSVSGGTTKVLFIMNLCQTAVRSTRRYILNNWRKFIWFCSKSTQR